MDDDLSIPNALEPSAPVEIDPQSQLGLKNDSKDLLLGFDIAGSEDPGRERGYSMDLNYFQNEDYQEKHVPYLMDQAMNQFQTHMNDAQYFIQQPMIFQANDILAQTRQFPLPFPNEEFKASVDQQQISQPSPSMCKPQASKQTSHRASKKTRGKCRNAVTKFTKDEKGKVNTLLGIFKRLLKNLSRDKSDLAFSIPCKILAEMKLVVEDCKYKTKQVQAYHALITYKDCRKYIVDILDYAIKFIDKGGCSHIPRNNQSEYTKCFTTKRNHLMALMEKDKEREVQQNSSQSK